MTSQLLYILVKNIVLSALHGWVGASLAVFMFFRPLKPWRIGKLKIWQGVIPAQQEKIADAISGVVAKELITPQALYEYLVRGEALERQVQAGIHSLMTAVVNREYPTLESMFPSTAGKLKEELKEGIKKGLADWTAKYLKDPEVTAWFNGLARRQLNRLLEKKLGEVWPEDKAVAFGRHFLEQLPRYLAGTEFQKAFAAFSDEQYRVLCSQTVPLGETLPELLKATIAEWPGKMLQILPDLVKRLQGNEELVERLTALILVNMEQLKAKGFWARVGIDLYQFMSDYRKDVKKFVRYDLFPRLGNFLNTPGIQSTLESQIKEQIDRLFQQPLGKLARSLSPGQLEQAREWLLAGSSRWLNSGTFKDWLEELFRERYCVLAGLSLSELAERHTGLKKGEIESQIALYGLDLLQQPVTLRFVRLAIRSLVEEMAQYRVGFLRDRIQPQTLDKIEAAAVGVVTPYLKCQIPAFIAGLDIKGIVKNRIENYSSRELVDMFQRVTVNNLQKIEIYGAVIGAVMGVFFGLANLRADAFWLITAVLILVISLLRWAGRK